MKHLLLTTIAAVLLVGCRSSISVHDAAFTGNIEAVKEFLADGADVNAKDDAYGGLTPLYVVATKEIAELLIAEGADVNAKNEEGGTPAHLAAEEGHQQIVELLISKGADVNAKDNKGRTPLDWAATWGLKETADYLRKHSGKTAEELKAEGN